MTIVATSAYALHEGDSQSLRRSTGRCCEQSQGWIVLLLKAADDFAGSTVATQNFNVDIEYSPELLDSKTQRRLIGRMS